MALSQGPHTSKEGKLQCPTILLQSVRRPLRHRKECWELSVADDRGGLGGNEEVRASGQGLGSNCTIVPLSLSSVLQGRCCGNEEHMGCTIGNNSTHNSLRASCVACWDLCDWSSYNIRTLNGQPNFDVSSDVIGPSHFGEAKSTFGARAQTLFLFIPLRIVYVKIRV